MTDSAAPVLSARDLTVGYRRGRAACAVMERVTLAVHPGEFVCLLGANGIGKSTLIRTLAGTQPALAGTVELEGERLAALTPIEVARRVAVVLTDRVSVDGLTVRRLVELGRYAHSNWLGWLHAEDAVAVDAAIDAAGVRHLVDRDLAKLSDGERQRVMIARALAQQPAALLLDEPTAFLDIAARVHVIRLLAELARARSMAVVMSTHEVELAMKTADTIWLVTLDRRVVAGPPCDVRGSAALARAFGEDVAQVMLHAE